MSGTTLAARLRPAAGLLGRVTDALAAHVVLSLAALVTVQIALAALLLASVERNGWLTYQGGDQIWLVTTGWLLGQGNIPYALVGYGWPVLLAPLTWITGASSLDLLPVTTVLQVCVLGPIATLAVYDIGARIAGRVAGLWCAAVWIALPYVTIPLFEDRYQERYTDQVLVQAVGLTQLADYPSTVLVVVAAALVLRSLDQGALREALLAGSIAGFAIGTKPANFLFLAGPALAYLLARAWRQALLFAAALAPAVLILLVWKSRGTGAIPALGAGAVHLASSSFGQLPVGGSFWERFPLHLEDWERNMSNLREFFWSARIAQWAPLAGALAVARRSLPAAGLLLGWVAAYVVVKGSSPVSSIEAGSFWRLVMPVFPAYAILLASIPLLVPTLPRRLGERIAALPGRRPSRRLVIAVAAVLAVVPAAFVLAGSPSRNGTESIELDGILVPVDGSTIRLTAKRVGEAQHVSWVDTTHPTRPFYRLYRTAGPGPDVHCNREGADRCTLLMFPIATTRGTSYVDGSPEPGVTYRVGVAANWVDDPEQGDVMVLSPPLHTAG